ncbi:hypothetical protein DCS32_11635 [Dokdonia sp. Dokd-P16]|uniref:hypothetical protein n=1 Tax=Dokdonia sp. Dokd-P16 TaxID=2173169 RepID=UPI000D549EAE|nr:hypothetical protein [Dokdonia sp. Dokd-P16]AWH74785.1 hypothetical protein DCS32_11635 [Dokdonia sp. Dokd-P16]
MKIACYLLSLIVLFLSTMPSCCEDNCDDELLATHTDLDHTDYGDLNTESTCSPFLTCGSCAGFVILKSTFELKQIASITTKTVVVYKPTFRDSFVASIWQPPKIS